MAFERCCCAVAHLTTCDASGGSCGGIVAAGNQLWLVHDGTKKEIRVEITALEERREGCSQNANAFK